MPSRTAAVIWSGLLSRAMPSSARPSIWAGAGAGAAIGACAGVESAKRRRGAAADRGLWAQPGQLAVLLTALRPLRVTVR